MSEYKLNEYELQSYFKSLCNSFYIAYSKVKRLEEEKKNLQSGYDEESLEIVKSLIELESWVTIPNKYVTLEYSREELLKEKERLEAEEQEYEKKSKELMKTLRIWSDNMWKEYQAIARILYMIRDNKFHVIVTTKQEIYALILFYANYRVEACPIININEECRKIFPTGEKIYDDFLYAYEEDMKCGKSNLMEIVYNQYF